jgi:chromosome segregation protein
MLSGVVSGPGAIVRLLSRVRLAETLADALATRRNLAHDESVITRTGEWLGRDWLRVNRGGDAHSGVLEREQRVKQLRVQLTASEDQVRDSETSLATCREELANAERERDQAQSRIQGAHRFHADLLGQLEGERARSQESTVRRERLEEEAAEVTREAGIGQDTLARARAELDRGLVQLDALD